MDKIIELEKYKFDKAYAEQLKNMFTKHICVDDWATVYEEDNENEE